MGIFVKSFEAPCTDRREILRYAGAAEGDQRINDLLDSCIAESSARLKYAVCYTELPIRVDGDVIDLSFIKVRSHSLSLNLSGCESIILFCATVGVNMDRLIAKYSSLSPARATLLQAIGSERVEALCNEFCRLIGDDLSADGYKLRPRFSPGYGDLDISIQREIFDVLDPAKRIGVSLNDNMMMSPSKSVTAIIGIEKVK